MLKGEYSVHTLHLKKQQPRLLEAIFNPFMPKYVKYNVKCGENLLKNALFRHKLYIIKTYCRVPCSIHIERGGTSS